MRILLTNDDGIHADGIQALYAHLAATHDVMFFAPETNCSAASYSLSIQRPLKVQPYGNRGYFVVAGTPYDCMHIALGGYLSAMPDLVISGINAGANLGDDTLHSGTVAGAMAARTSNIPSIAISAVGAHYRRSNAQGAASNDTNESTKTLAHPYGYTRPFHYDTALAALDLVLETLSLDDLRAYRVLNLNAPAITPDKLLGLRVATLGERAKSTDITATHNANGDTFYWLGDIQGPVAADGTDFEAIRAGYASLTPLTADLTATAHLDALNDAVGNAAPSETNAQ